MPQNSSTTMDRIYLDVLDDGGHRLKWVEVTEGATIGRASGTWTPSIVAPAECQSTSRRHAVVGFSDGRPMLTDLSRFGTIVNDRVVLGESVPLKENDIVVFGGKNDGWRVRVQFQEPQDTYVQDALVTLIVSDAPRQLLIFGRKVDERLGDKPFRLLQLLANNRDQWFPIDHLADILWPIPDDAPEMPNIALAKARRRINDLLKPHLEEADAIDMIPFQGYRMKSRLDPMDTSQDSSE